MITRHGLIPNGSADQTLGNTGRPEKNSPVYGSIWVQSLIQLLYKEEEEEEEEE
jgi:hypothetical protein